jgi:hypothetical protein
MMRISCVFRGSISKAARDRDVNQAPLVAVADLDAPEVAPLVLVLEAAANARPIECRLNPPSFKKCLGCKVAVKAQWKMYPGPGARGEIHCPCVAYF